MLSSAPLPTDGKSAWFRYAEEAPLALPLLLAGPIVRRVEPDLASVWVAISEPAASVTLSVWEGRATSGAANVFATSDGGPDGGKPRRIGDHLFLALPTVRLSGSGKSFVADRLYSYDLAIQVGATTHTLGSLGMLEPSGPGEKLRLPLGYARELLPGFALPPAKLEDLRLVYGSCRRPGHPDPDAMAWIDDLMSEQDLYSEPSKRPHQLFLGGDQIYADEVETLMMLPVTQLAQELFGRSPAPSGPAVVKEKVFVDGVLRRRAGSPGPSRDNPLASYEDEPADVTDEDPRLPADAAHFPPGHRLGLTQRAAQFTSVEGRNHLISLGEFAAAYLMVWSNACWSDEVPGATVKVGNGPAEPLTWSRELPAGSTIALPPLSFPDRIPAQLYLPGPVETDEHDQPKALRASHAVHRAFLAGLPKVQRVLANVPTYMIFDDHDVTDDFFLNPTWRNRVLNRALGQTILTNAMVAYALFQDWGNDPLRYDSGTPAELLSKAGQLFPPGATSGPDKDVFERLAGLFAHDKQNEQVPGGVAFGGLTPPMTWHYTVDGPKHRVLVLDNRTRRSYLSTLGPPGNLSAAALRDQVPDPPLPAGREILVVVVPLPVIGPSALDELVAPLSYRVFDLVSDRSSIAPSSATGRRQMTGVNPDAIEAWAFDAETFEHLLRRLAPYQRVVLLSGDVHYSSGSLMSYWTGPATQPARIAQFTCSGFKNVMPNYIAAVDRSAGFAQQMVRAGLGTERLGWNETADDLIAFPTGRSAKDLVPVMRARLRQSPVMVPTWGWLDDNPEPEGEQPPTPDPTLTTRLNPDKPPDWRWRVLPLLDERLEADRPEPIRVNEIEDEEVEADLADPQRRVKAYTLVAGRHQNGLERLRHARQLMFRSAFAICRFERPDDTRLRAVNEVYTAFADPGSVEENTAPAKPLPYLVQTADLGPLQEEPPGPLRVKVIETPPVDPVEPA